MCRNIRSDKQPSPICFVIFIFIVVVVEIVLKLVWTEDRKDKVLDYDLVVDSFFSRYNEHIFKTQ